MKSSLWQNESDLWLILDIQINITIFNSKFAPGKNCFPEMSGFLAKETLCLPVDGPNPLYP